MQDRLEEVDLAEVIFDMSVSLDGFVRASNATPEQPLGDVTSLEGVLTGEFVGVGPAGF